MQGSGGNILSYEIAISDGQVQNLKGQMSFHQDPIQISQGKVDCMPSPRPPKVGANIKVENEAPVVLIDPINVDLNNKIRKKEKIVQPSNLNSNRFISY